MGGGGGGGGADHETNLLAKNSLVRSPGRELPVRKSRERKGAKVGFSQRSIVFTGQGTLIREGEHTPDKRTARWSHK